jgi:glycosyltransferase involved in cell wall biosynthesis
MTDRRLLCVYPWLALGGADKFNLDMITCLANYGWQTTIVTTRPSVHAWRDEFAKVSNDIIDLTRYTPEEYPAQFVEIIRSRSIDTLVVSHSVVGYDLLPYLRAHLPNLTYVDYCHYVEPSWLDGGYPRMSLSYANEVDLQIVSSHNLKRWMCERGGDSDRIAVCTTNIDTTTWDPARYDRQKLRAQLGIPASAPVVLFAARLERQKQPLLALSVMKQVASLSPDVHFLVAGDGLFANCMRNFLRWYGLDQRVRMLGAVSNQRIRELLVLSDVFFLPSEMEGISLAIYEAMAMCTVPLSADVGGQAELVTAVCGVLIPPQRRAQQVYAEELLRLLRDPPLLEQMRDAARQRVITHFELDTMGARMNDLLLRAHTLRLTNPRPPVSVHAADTAARAAVKRARQVIRMTPRRRLRLVYWRLTDRAGWRLVFLGEKIRRALRYVGVQRNQMIRSAGRFAEVEKH